MPDRRLVLLAVRTLQFPFESYFTGTDHISYQVLKKIINIFLLTLFSCCFLLNFFQITLESNSRPICPIFTKRLEHVQERIEQKESTNIGSVDKF